MEHQAKNLADSAGEDKGPVSLMQPELTSALGAHTTFLLIRRFGVMPPPPDDPSREPSSKAAPAGAAPQDDAKGIAGDAAGADAPLLTAQVTTLASQVAGIDERLAALSADQKRLLAAVDALTESLRAPAAKI